MKKIYTTIILLAIYSLSSNAQNVNIPDAAFKAALVGNFGINTNMDSEIQLTEAASFNGTINVTGLGIADLTGIEAFTLLDVLNCNYNSIASLNVSANTALTELRCKNNELTSLDISANTALAILSCSFNHLTNLNITANTALTELDCYLNILTSIDVSTNTALTLLYCNNNLITSLDVSTNTALVFLDCSYNQLTSLDASANSALTALFCFQNQLTSLNVQNGNNLNINSTYFDASINPLLTCIQVDDVAYSTANWIYIDAGTGFSTNCCVVSIPDANFKTALLANLSINTNSDTEIQCTEAAAYTGTIDVTLLGIADLTGIEAFTSLAVLYCGVNNLTSLDISANTALTNLYCSGNFLTALNLSANTALTTLYCSANQLTSLDVSANTALTTIYCSANQLTSLDVSANTSLIELYCNSNQLTSLNTTGNTALMSLGCYTNQLTSLSLTTNTALDFLDCSENQLTSLDVSTNTALTDLECYVNQLTSLNVQNGNNLNMGTANFDATLNPLLTCIQVDDVAYSTTNWIYIDAGVSFSTNCNPCVVSIPDANFKAALLANLSININSDTEIQCTEAAAYTGTINVTGLGIADLTGIEAFTSLDVLYCDNNNLTSLNLSANTALEFLNCSNNQLTSLDVTANTALTDFYCGINQLTSLNVTANTLLQVLDCSVNPFTSLNVTANTALSDLYCNNNQLTSLDVTANAVLGNLECNGNQLTSLDVSVDTALSILDCSGNQLTSLNVKNNNNINFEDFYANNNPNLNCIQVDDSAWSTTNWTNIDSVASFSTNCSSTVSVNDMINHTNTVSIYPNPGNGVFTISQSNTNKTEIEIYNILGELIYQSTINNHQSSIEIDLTKQPKGIYFVKTTDNNRSVTNKKIVIQ